MPHFAQGDVPRRRLGQAATRTLLHGGITLENVGEQLAPADAYFAASVSAASTAGVGHGRGFGAGRCAGGQGR